MTRTSRLLIVAFTLLVARAAVAAPAAPAPAMRRFAIVASANDGGVGRARLRFADSDARAIADVLQSLGGLSSNDLALVASATPQALLAAFVRLKAEMAAASGVRRELFFYYSGHSDEDGLLLGNERLGYRDLRGLLESSGADVRIAILDSCASGALISLKGIRRKPSFLSDLSTNTRGHAFLTASAADEAAQESERIGAAFFTHYLVSGLRGAADVTRDGHVTLNEAYQFAYHETLRRTERTAAGPQHPAYDISLSGRGDFPITEVAATGATLVLEEKVFGRIYVRDRSGRLLVELRKEPLYPVELGLGPGEYMITLDADGRPAEARVTLTDGKRSHLGVGAFKPVAVVATTARGAAPPPPPPVPVREPVISAEAPNPGLYRRVPFEVMLVPGLRTGGDDGRPVLNHFALGVVTQSDALRGMQLGLAGNIVRDGMRGVQLAVGFNLTRGPSRGMQVAAVNLASDAFVGAQIADGLNVARGDLQGAQVGPINWASGDFLGGQVGVVNQVRGNMRGLQLGVLGVGRGHLTGAQVGVLNVMRGIHGPQLGVLNLTSFVEGLQLGVVNYGTRVKGTQIGVLNFADSVDGLSFGILSFVRDGYHPVVAWTSDILPMNLGIKLGSKHVYTVLGFGSANPGDKQAKHGGTFGFGAHLPILPRLFVDVDLVGTYLADAGDWTPEDQTLVSLRAAVGFQIWKHFAVTFGPSYSMYLRRANGPDVKPGWGAFEASDVEDGWEFRRFPGLQLGIQL